MAGEYTPLVVGKGLAAFLRQLRPRRAARSSSGSPSVEAQRAEVDKALGAPLPARPPTFCTGCPERPVFSAMKLLRQEMGPVHVVGRHRLPLVCDLRALQPGQLDPGLRHVAGLGGGGVGHAGQPADQRHGRRRLLAQRPDHRRRRRRVQQGRQRAGRHEQRLLQRHRPAGHPLHQGGAGRPRQGPRHRGGAEEPGRAVDQARAHLWRGRRGQHAARGAAHRRRRASRSSSPTANASSRASAASGPRSRARWRPASAWCARASGSIRRCAPATTPASASPAARRSPSSRTRTRCAPIPIAHVNNDCVGCGLCGEVAHAAQLCPSFAQIDIIQNPTRWDRLKRRAVGGADAPVRRRRAARRPRSCRRSEPMARGQAHHGS